MLDAQKIVDLLNDARQIDPAAISTLVSIKRMCSKELANHPHIIVNGEKEGPYYLGFIGLINGMLNAAGSEQAVAAIVDDDKNQNLVGFTVVSQNDVVAK